MLRDGILSAVMPNATISNVFMLNGVMPSVVMLSVVAPWNQLLSLQKEENKKKFFVTDERWTKSPVTYLFLKLMLKYKKK